MSANTTRVHTLGLMALSLALLLAAPATAAAQQGAQERPPAGQGTDFRAAFSASGWDPTPEEMDEALDKWLNEFALYIITDEEREIFEALPTHEQKLAFIQRFWDIRDPTPGTELNEYRREHMQRWATANRRFSAGRPGWSTDRGRIFIIMGPPNNLQRNPMGRDGSERASEVWSYNMADNPLLPTVYDLNFVDFKGTGDYELVTDLDSAAPVMTEQFGYTNNPLDVYALRRHAQTVYDERFMQYSLNDPTAIAQEFMDFQQNLREVLRIPEIHKDRLASLRDPEVAVSVDFEDLQFANTVQFFQAVDDATAVQATVALEYDELQPSLYGLNHHFSVDVLVALEANGEVAAEDEKRLNFALTAQELEQLRGTQVLQTFQLLVPPGDYDLVVLVRDNTKDMVGREQYALAVPDLSGDGLRVSSVTLASRIESVQPQPGQEPRDFQHGNMRVVPNVGNIFYSDQPLLVYLQAYGMELDRERQTNDIVIHGSITASDGTVRQIPEHYPNPTPFRRQSFSLGMPLSSYRPGVYQLELVIEDRVAGTAVTTVTDFAVIGAGQSLGSR